MKGVIFDLDGTLIDSLWIWDKVDRDVLKMYDKIPDDDYVKDVHNLNFGECVIYLKDRYNLPLTYEELGSLITEKAFEEYSNINTLISGAKDFICKLKENGIKIGLTTSCLRRMSEAVLKNCEVLHLFDACVYSDEFGKNKTAPDIFIKTAELLNLDAEQIVVFEDLPMAIKSAHLAGMGTIGVKDETQKDKCLEIISLCKNHINNYNELDLVSNKIIKIS